MKIYTYDTDKIRQASINTMATVLGDKMEAYTWYMENQKDLGDRSPMMMNVCGQADELIVYVSKRFAEYIKMKGNK